MPRSTEKELIDLGDYTPEEYTHCLTCLGQIGHWLGGDRSTLKTIPVTPTSWLEVGCGGGQFLHRLAQTYPECAVHGIDLSSPAIIFAKEHWSHPNLTFSLQKQKALDFPDNHFDIVSATLVCHHMTDDELHTFLNQATHIAKKGVLLNDLHRHSLASLLFAATAPLLFHNRLITHDGLLSIRRAFTKADWLHLLKPFPNARLSWYFPFRWTVWIPTED